MKTASRMVGTAAFLEGYYVQDSPLYGAERRGAPVTAYTRISPDTILERGIILYPDVIIIADDSLIEDSMANPLQGSDASTVMVINSTNPGIREKYGIAGHVNIIDATGVSIDKIGKGSAISSALAGAACRVIGYIRISTLEKAVIKELRSLGISGELIKKNVEAAVKCFEGVPSNEILSRETAKSISTKTITLQYQDPDISSPSILASGNIVERQTGKWRTFKPVIDYDECNQCWICFVRCPEGVIYLDDSEDPCIDYDHCKGCLICYEECPVKAITIERETKTL